MIRLSLRCSTRIASIGAAFLLVLGVAACGGGGEEEGALKDVKLILGYQDSIAYVGLMIAKDRYFEAEGLNVETLPSDGSSFVIQQLISGNVKYGVAGGAETLIAAAEGADLRGIATVDAGIYTLAVSTDSDVQSVADLKGKTVGITGLGGGEVPLLRAALREAGLTVGSDVKLLPVGAGGPVAAQALKSGKIAAYGGATNDLLGLEQAGLAFRRILSEKFTNLPNDTIVVSQSVLDDKEGREIAIKLARAWLKGTIFASENHAAFLEIACQSVPVECEDQKIAEGFFDLSLGTALAAKTSGGKWGENDHTRWGIVLDALLSNEVTEPIDVTSVLTNDYIDEINDFDEEEVREEARAAS